MSTFTREDFEHAARAAGIRGTYAAPGEFGRRSGGIVTFIGFGHIKVWNPADDDSDSRRLQVALGLSVEPYPFYSPDKHSVVVKQRRRGDMMREANPTEVIELYGDDPGEATRIAVLRCAIAIGKAMLAPDARPNDADAAQSPGVDASDQQTATLIQP